MPHKQTSKMADIADTATDSLLDIPDSISVKFLPDHKKIADRLMKRGLNYFIQGYIHDIKVYSAKKPQVRVVARCWRSMRKSEKPHRLHIEITGESCSESNCSCKVGLTGHCSHIIGLIKTLQGFKLHGIKSVLSQQSCTSIPQQWHVPRGEKIAPVPINHLVIAKPIESRKRKPVLCQLNTDIKLSEVTTFDIEKCQECTCSPLEYIISSKRPMVETPLGKVQLGSILSYQTRNLKAFQPVTTHGCGDLCINRDAPIKLDAMWNNLRAKYTISCPENLEKATILQAGSTDWHSARKTRLTASNFGLVLNRKSQPNEKLLSTLFRPSIINAPSLTYGKRNESKAKSKYLKQYPERHIHDCGFVVNNEFPFLGATPDGKLCDNGIVGIVEIKCPYSARDLTVSEACTQVKNFFLQKDQSGQISLKTNHAYYAQIQGQLMITGCPFCEFIVYCPNESDLFVHRILPDIEFMISMLKVLSDFFEKYADKYLSTM